MRQRWSLCASIFVTVNRGSKERLESISFWPSRQSPSCAQLTQPFQGKRICLAFAEDKLDAPKALGPASSRPIFQPSGRRNRVAHSAALLQCVHERFQWPRLDPAVQDNCEALVVP